MAKREKIILTADGRDRRSTGYYATPSFVAEFLAGEMLRHRPDGRLVLDPCVGREELARPFFRAGKRVDGIDLEDYGPYRFATVRRGDFFDVYRERRAAGGATARLPYDYYVANPPYNCHESDYIRSDKAELKRIFPSIGVKNTYAMFLSAMIDLAADGAVIGVITLDSFLTGRMHQPLRRQILAQCAIHALLLCPTDLFRDQRADVRTCILVLQKGRQFQRRAATLNRPSSTAEFRRLLDDRTFDHRTLGELLLDGAADRQEFIVGCPRSVRRLFRHPRIGDRWPCVAGISTGDDRRYLSARRTTRHGVAFYKNPGRRRFYMPPDAFLVSDYRRVAGRVANFMVRNQGLLGRRGIACSSMGVPFSACYRPARTLFGVNPNLVCEPPTLWWLLAYLNSSLVTYFVRGVLIRTNMVTPGYAARIPLVPLGPGVRRRLGDIAAAGWRRRVGPGEAGPSVEAIDELVFAEAGLGGRDRDRVRGFCKNLLRAT